MTVQIVRRPWSHFLRDPVFGRAWFDDLPDGTRRYTRAVVYVHALDRPLPVLGRLEQPQWVTERAVSHESGHVDDLIDRCTSWWPCEMFEGRGWLADSAPEKIVAAVLAGLRRVWTGSWRCGGCVRRE